MSLTTYRQKRRFDRTPEPRPTRPAGKRGQTLRFVVQKHRASRLHYDFRLEWNGVLLSWAVPKGPSLDPDDKRLAVEVEDHPIDYAEFEGIIPADNYGAGTVMVWDRGTYSAAAPDVGKSRRDGRIDFTLHGKKLTGTWLLVRSGRAARDWLLIKRHDDAAVRGDVTDAAPRSVLSKRLMVEIAYDEGGDVDQAASADPTAAVEALLRNRKAASRRPRKKPSVRISNRATNQTPAAVARAKTPRARPAR